MHTPAMQRTEAWYRAQAEKGRRQVQALLDWSAASRTAAGRIYPHLQRKAEIASSQPQPAPNSIASKIYPHLPREGSK
jgi:hypothetical protein